MGLLDTQQSNGLMDFGMGLLSAGGPSRMPVGFGQAMGQGMQQMQAGNQQRQAMQMQDMQMQNQGMQLQQHQMQLEQAKKSIADNEMAKVKLTKYVQSLPDTDPNKAHIIQGLTLGVSAKDMYDKINPKQEAFTLPPGGVRFGADNKPIASVPLERKAPEGMNYGVNGTLEEIPGYVVMKSKIAAAGRNPEQAAPYYSPVQTAQGVMAFNARTGRMEPIQVNGQNVVGAQADPALQGNIAGAKEFGKTTAEDRAKGMIDAPRVIATANEALRQSDELLKHPGFTQAVGASSMLGVQKIPGTNAKDFMNRLDQIKGGAFLEAFNSLKGGGQITEVEGKKATDAIARMDNATSEAEFKNAVRDYQNVIRSGMNRAKMRAGTNIPAPAVAPAPGGAKFLGFE